jgi:hypothetical protein
MSSIRVYGVVFGVIALAAACAYSYMRCAERERRRAANGEQTYWHPSLVGRPGGVPDHVDPNSLAVFGGGPQQPYPPQGYAQQPYPPHQPPQPQQNFVATGVPVQSQYPRI